MTDGVHLLRLYPKWRRQMKKRRDGMHDLSARSVIPKRWCYGFLPCALIVQIACNPPIAQVCDEGQTRACTCPGDALGEQECSKDGTRWISCHCYAQQDAGTVDASSARDANTAPDIVAYDSLVDSDGSTHPDASGPDVAYLDSGRSDIIVFDANESDAALPYCGNDFLPCAIVTTPDYTFDICIAGICASPGACGDALCNAPGPSFALPDTNQRVCSDNSNQLVTCPEEGQNFFGQDAQAGWDTSHAASERFSRSNVVNDQPVVIDQITGLEWQGCQAGLSGDDCGEGEIATMFWGDAMEFCEQLEWGGHQDWRLPDLHELHSLVDYGRTTPAIDVNVFPATEYRWFWSSASLALNSHMARSVNFENGLVGGGSKSTWDRVRCVRHGSGSSPVWPAQRYNRDTSVTDQPVVTDAVTQFMWQGCVKGLSGSSCENGTVEIETWQTALSYCSTLDWGGYQDWLLPDIKALRSLSDDRVAYPNIDPLAFPATPHIGEPSWHWSSTSWGVGTFAFLVGFDFGSVATFEKSSSFSVRCARSSP